MTAPFGRALRSLKATETVAAAVVGNVELGVKMN
jgi:hypothetical protein